MIDRISPPELEKLIRTIQRYQDDGVGHVSANKDSHAVTFGREPHPYQDLLLATKNNSPLGTFFAALAVLSENPNEITQTHLDSMRPELDESRRTAFAELQHTQEGASVIRRLAASGLVENTPYSPKAASKQEAQSIPPKKGIRGFGRLIGRNKSVSEPASQPKEEPPFQLSSALQSLSVTPLAEVKETLKKVNYLRFEDMMRQRTFGGGVVSSNTGGDTDDNLGGHEHSLAAHRNTDENSEQERLRHAKRCYEDERLREEELLLQAQHVANLHQSRQQADAAWTREIEEERSRRHVRSQDYGIDR